MRTLLTTVQRKTGIALKDTRLKRATAFIEQLLDEMTERDLQFFLEEEALDHPLWQEIIQVVTVGETYFFRNKPHFEALSNQILPELIRKRRRQNRKFLRIWIAGCATGEEPYSIAMLLYDLLPDLKEWSIFLLATDINTTFLETAKQGIFRRRAFRNETPEHIINRFFSEIENGYKISHKIQQMVTFTPLNLIDSTYPNIYNNTTAMDLILCRNVTIYFEKDTTRRIVAQFYETLAEDGWLLVGHSEPQLAMYDAYRMHNINGAIFYQKTAAVEPTPSSSPPPSPYRAQQLPVEQPTDDMRFSTPNYPLQQEAVQAETAPAMGLAELLEAAQNAVNREYWEEAIGLLDAAKAADKFNATVHYLRGIVYTHTGKSSAAIKSFRQTVYCDPDFAMAYFAIGELLSQTGSDKEAATNWVRAHNTIRHLHPEAILAGTDDFTVEMLQELLEFRLDRKK